MGYSSNFGLDDFELYKEAREFRKKIYALIKLLPPAEKYALDTQMRRAAISVSNNIAEGHGRWYFQENIRFCRIARGSVEELIDDLNLCIDEHYADPQLFNSLREHAHRIIARINSYISYLRKSRQGTDTET